VSLLLVKRRQIYITVGLLKGKWEAGIVGRECLSMSEYVTYRKVLTCTN